MATEAQTQPAEIQLKSVQKVSSIPLVSEGLTYAHNTLSSSPYTQGVYNTAQSVTVQAYKVTQPIQSRLAPLITRADDLAAKGLEAVESKFPYPFHASSDQVLGDIKTQTDSAYKAFDTNVKTPAFGVAQNVDSSLAPLVDRFDTLVQRISSKPPSPEGSPSTSAPSVAPEQPTSQVGRAYALSLTLRDSIYHLSGEQVARLQQQSPLVQKTIDTIYNLNATLLATYNSTVTSATSISHETATRISALSNAILNEFQSLKTQLSQTTSSLPPKVNETTSQISSIVQSQAPLGEKVSKIAEAVGEFLKGVVGVGKQAGAEVKEGANGVTEKVNGELH